LVADFAQASRIVLNEINPMRADGSLPSGKDPKALREERIAPKLYGVQSRLRAEVEASRDIIPRIVIGKNQVEQRGGEPGEGE